jgi:hypothetical protein
MKLEPIRTLDAVSPAGVGIWFRKFGENDRELSWGCGNLDPVSHGIFWRAKLAAEKPGEAQWQKARQLLIDAGWTVEE